MRRKAVLFVLVFVLSGISGNASPSKPGGKGPKALWTAVDSGLGISRSYEVALSEAMSEFAAEWVRLDADCYRDGGTLQASGNQTTTSNVASGRWVVWFEQPCTCWGTGADSLFGF
jgi:hypothetical protein